MPDIESHIDTVGGAKFITVYDVQRAYWQKLLQYRPAHKNECHKKLRLNVLGPIRNWA